MSNLLYARSQMAMSLAFHIVFAAVGVAMPALMVIAEILWRRTGDPAYLSLTRAWAKGTAVLFAVGAVSGTVLSFELGLLFPGFMRHAGAVIGMPFSLEGIAFFTEAVFLGIYLYGWNRVSPRVHVLSGVLVAVSGLASAVFVTLANAWMNAPRGFDVIHEGGALRFVNVDPLTAMTTPFALHEIVHMALAAYMSTAFAVAAIHAVLHLRRSQHEVGSFHLRAIGIALAVAIPTSLAQPLVGHYAGHQVAQFQPLKLAAFERHYHTGDHAPLQFLGIPDDEAQVVHGAIKIPLGLSILAFGDPGATVAGLDQFPRADWPPAIIHYAFDLMVSIGTALAGVSLFALGWYLKYRAFPDGKRFLRVLAACGPAGFIALEAGWVVTEVGRQPFIIYNVLRTADAATPMPGLAVTFSLFTILYVGLAAAVAVILTREIRATSRTLIAPASATINQP